MEEIATEESEYLQERIQKVWQEYAAEGKGWKDVLDELDDIFDRIGLTAAAPYHIRTLFGTKLMEAYHAHHWHQLTQHPDHFPMLEYHTMDDGAVRPDHALMNGFIAPVNSAVWNVWYPPNGWNCRCIVLPLHTEEIKEYGLHASPVVGLPSPDAGFDYHVAI